VLSTGPQPSASFQPLSRHENGRRWVIIIMRRERSGLSRLVLCGKTLK
jgi:hypothetical protein